MSLPVEIAVPLPANQTYFYSIKDSLKRSSEIGKRVLVPLRNRLIIGFIVGFNEPPGDIELKNVVDIIDESPLFDEKRLEFYRWIADYYITSLGLVLKFAHPGGIGTTLRRFLKLTSSGERKLKQGSINDKERNILSALDVTGEITAEKLFDLVEGTDFNSLNRLMGKGLVEYSYFLKELKPKYKRVVKARDFTPESYIKLAKRMPSKGSILEFIKSHGKVEVDELKEIFPNVNSHVKWLDENGFIETNEVEVFRDPFKNVVVGKPEGHKLTVDQDLALSKITENIKGGDYSTFLLHGVTGSGKTEVYIRAIEKALSEGKQAIVLVPEISLTPLLFKRFKSRFGDNVAVVHSLLSEGERFDAWRRANDGRVNIVIGPRSAVFAPFKNLGVIVVDEEHEFTYKQDENPFYNARDLAVMLGQKTGSTVILGSATPSVESYSNCIRQKFNYLNLPLRIGKQQLPSVHIVDMRKNKKALFSKTLESEIIANYKEGNQTILFLNRRGYSTFLIKQDSGEIFNCPNCSIPFTYHQKGNMVKCHYCGTGEDYDTVQKDMDSPLRGLGFGTQLIEEELKKLLPSARIGRMDSDATGSKSKLMNFYEKLERKEIDIVVGTQMVAKGHDLSGVTLVGVVSADNLLSIPDFRSGERTFQMITQVAGRAGRGKEPGKVIVQTYNPNHPSIKFAAEHDSTAFLRKEIELRELIDYPPFTKLVNFRFSGSDEKMLGEMIKKFEHTTKSAISKMPQGKITMLGPSVCPIYKIKNRFRWQMILKSNNLNLLHAFSRSLYERFAVSKGRIIISLDVDPNNFS